MNIHETYVSLEVAKLLKRAGFDWEVTSYYQNSVFYHYVVNNRCRLVIMNQNSAPDYMDQYSAPTLSVAQKWLREVKNIHLYIEPHYYSHYDESGKLTDESFAYYYVGTYDFDEEVDISGYNKTYEETLEAGIKKALELILEKGE